MSFFNFHFQCENEFYRIHLIQFRFCLEHFCFISKLFSNFAETIFRSIASVPKTRLLFKMNDNSVEDSFHRHQRNQFYNNVMFQHGFRREIITVHMEAVEWLLIKTVYILQLDCHSIRTVPFEYKTPHTFKFRPRTIQLISISINNKKGKSAFYKS